MHDIVRDFTLASQAGSGLEQRQRSFIATLVGDVSSQASSGSTAQVTVSAYAASSLGHHLRGALSPPFANDDLASTLFLHDSPSVVAQALASVDRTNVDALIAHYLKTKAFWPASKVSAAIWSELVGLADEDRKHYMLQTISTLSHVDKKSQPGALGIEVMTCFKFLLKFPSDVTKRQTDVLIAATELNAADLDKADLKAHVTARQTVAYMKIGWFCSPYSFTLDLAQAKQGSSMLLEVFLVKYGDRASLHGFH